MTSNPTPDRSCRIYVAGPYTADPETCTAAAIAAGAELLDAGHAPFVPHLAHYWETLHEARPYEDWMRIDLAWLVASDAVLRLPGDSSGADREVALARAEGVPVFTALPDLLRWAATPSVSAVDQTTRDRIAEAPCVCGEPETPGTRHRTDGPCYVVDAQLRAAALAIARVEAWKWADGEPLESKPLWQSYLAQAAAVLAVLPPTTDRSAVLREEAALIRAHCPDHLDSNSAEGSWINCHCDVADDMERRLADEAQQPAVGARHPKCVLCGHRTCTLGQPCGVIATERGDLPEPCGCTGVGARQPDTETQAVQHAPGKAVLCPDCSAKGRAVCTTAERPRCPHCQMPHDLGPGSSAVLACASIRASIADRDASSAVPGRSAATSTDEETRS